MTYEVFPLIYNLGNVVKIYPFFKRKNVSFFPIVLL